MVAPVFAFSRAMLLFLGMLFIGAGTFQMNNLLGFVILFIGYFMLPDKLGGTDQPFVATLGILRFVMGIAIALAMWLSIGTASSLGGAISLMAVGLLVVNLPQGDPNAATASPGSGGTGLGRLKRAAKNGYIVVNNTLVSDAQRPFPILQIFSGLIVGAGAVWGSFELFFTLNSTVTGIVFATLAGITTLVAFTVPGKEKGIASAPLLILLMLTVTTAAPATIGEPLFGVYWPQVEEGIEGVSEALRPAGQAGTTLGTGFECLVNPIECQQQFKPKKQTQNTIEAVEITSMELLAEPRIFRLEEDKTVLLNIENKGQEKSGTSTVTFDDPYLDNDDENKVGNVEVECPQDPPEGEEWGEDECIIDPLFPNENTQIIAHYHIDLTEAPSDTEVRGQFVNYDAQLTYEYGVTSSLPVEIMNSDFYDELARNDRLEIEEVPTTDSGGPVRLGVAIFNNRMPIRAGLDNAPVLLELDNQGTGDVISVSEAEVDVSGVVQDEGEDGDRWREKGQVCSEENGELSFRVSENNPIESPRDADRPEDSRSRATCIIPLREVDVETQSTTMTGGATYRYRLSEQEDSEVSFGTGKRCECQTGEENPPSMTVGPEFCEADEGEQSDCQKWCTEQHDADGTCQDQ